MEDFLLRHFRPDHPRHLRIKPTNAVAANDKVGRVENVSSYKFQYQAIDNYLIDTDHGVIVDVEATRAIRQAEVKAARTMLSEPRRASA
jgi:hypothetical protein